jgi:Zn-dependent protease
MLIMASGKPIGGFALPGLVRWLTFPRVKWSFQLARIAGIDVRVHVTFFLLLAWYGFIYYSDGGWTAMVSGLFFIVLLFGCVVLHEFGHALAAKAYGIRTPDITLLPIGGVARLERFPDKPWQELVVALAGPAVNVVIVLGLYIVLGSFFNIQDLADIAGGRGNLLVKLLAINLILVVFNLLPAFPMDGGRVLRALLAMRMKHARATRIAAVVGQAMAVGFGLLGVLGGNPFLIFIAVFVFFGAQTEANYAVYKESAEDTCVSEIMRPTGPVLQQGMSVAQAIQLAMKGHLGILPVTDPALRLTGMVPAERLAEAFLSDPNRTIDQLAWHSFEVIPANASLGDARMLVLGSSQEVFPVINTGGQLVGLTMRDDLASALPSIA